MALALREIILEEQPDASESVYQVYTVAIWFGFSGKMKDMFCYITTNAKHINLGFPRGRGSSNLLNRRLDVAPHKGALEIPFAREFDVAHGLAVAFQHAI